ncbi:PREDICTED: probable inactive histone-lysine N-methyltransferase SUVR1 [Camelina sativa]|uniref:Probable inactive histone-lysine N-methyltransferase SUVR1 n=1 Tax=Camelina sativa TaxID=90675 RepID=A0ABM0VXJ3_CAMSA|nr:PREDICTED: probable inactive histone-lysine N-methyltransferase SUVR1 [Camelina sativa]
MCYRCENFLQEAKVKLVLKNLLEAYDKKWDFIEAEDYKVLIDAIFEEEDPQATETKKKQEKREIKPLVNEEEDEMDEEEIPLKKRLRPKRGRGCDNNTSLSICSAISQKPNKDASKIQPEEEDEDDDELPPLKRYIRRSGERGLSMTVYNNASPSFSSRMSMDPEEVPSILPLPAVPTQDEKDSEDGALIILNDEDEPNTDHKPLILDTGNCSAPMLEMEKSNTHVEERDRETEEILRITTTKDVPPSATAASVELASSTSGEAKICLTFSPATGETTSLCLPSMEDFRRAMEEKCLKSYKIVHPEFSVLGFMKDLCSCYVDMVNNSTNQSLETETVSKVGDESAAACSMGLVVVPECEISSDGWRAINNVKDITVGEENVEIPWMLQ